jgi:hypothetical protein
MQLQQSKDLSNAKWYNKLYELSDGWLYQITMVEFPTITFLVVKDLFDRYTIVVNESLPQETSVYCEECEQWVETYDGNLLTTTMPTDLYEKIIDDHEHQVNGVPVSFTDTESIL